MAQWTGKYSSALDCIGHGLVEMSADEQSGSVQGSGWAEMAYGPFEKHQCVEAAGAYYEDDDEFERAIADLERCTGIIVEEDSQGFISVSIFFNDKESLDRDWAELSEELDPQAEDEE
jgi:hypothetical protein